VCHSVYNFDENGNKNLLSKSAQNKKMFQRPQDSVMLLLLMMMMVRMRSRR